jgi:hypothetical protein
LRKEREESGKGEGEHQIYMLWGRRERERKR